jgi:hypothetical protein
MLSLMIVFGWSKNLTSDNQIPTPPTTLINHSHPLVIAETTIKEKTLESVNYPLKTFVIILLLLQHQLLGIGIQ